MVKRWKWLSGYYKNGFSKWIRGYVVWSRGNIFYNIWKQTFRSVRLKFPLLLKNPTAQVEKFYAKKKFYANGVMYSSGAKYVKSKNGIKYSAIKMFTYLVAKFIPREYFLNRLEMLKDIYKFEDSKYVECLNWNDCFKPLKKDWFEDYEYVKFESIMVKIPKGYDMILKTIYGNYMQLPPKENRFPHHGYKLYKK